MKELHKGQHAELYKQLQKDLHQGFSQIQLAKNVKNMRCI